MGEYECRFACPLALGDGGGCDAPWLDVDIPPGAESCAELGTASDDDTILLAGFCEGEVAGEIALLGPLPWATAAADDAARSDAAVRRGGGPLPDPIARSAGGGGCEEGAAGGGLTTACCTGTRETEAELLPPPPLLLLPPASGPTRAEDAD